MNNFYQTCLNPPYKTDSEKYNLIVETIYKFRKGFSSNDIFKTVNRKLDKNNKLEWHKFQDTLRVLVKHNLIEYHFEKGQNAFSLQLTQKTTVK